MPGIQLKTNLEPELSGGVVKFVVKNRPTGECYDRLWSSHRMAIAKTDAGDASGLRFSPHIYNSLEEIDQAVAAVGKLA
jgi:selenocysteine lyase/cysteine desulfurase